MARSAKTARNIVVNDVGYHWRATGNDGYISVTIWPSSNLGPAILCNFDYQESWIPSGEGQYSSAGNQIVITNRIVRRVIDLAVTKYGYDPSGRGKELNLRRSDGLIELDDAIRATKATTQNQ